MAKYKRCKNCAHYTPDEVKGYHAGVCALMGDINDEPNKADRCSGWDYGSYRAGVYVGPEFGCIHFTKKTKPT
jgi:hypothetical protein